MASAKPASPSPRSPCPRSEFLDNAHIGTVCTRVQFREGAVPGEKCPAASVYGHVSATTPILEGPLEGPIYLRSSEHKLPDLVAALHHQEINVALVGRVDSVKGGGIRNTFEVVPDAPVTSADFVFDGAAKGLLENSHQHLQGQAPRHGQAQRPQRQGLELSGATEADGLQAQAPPGPYGTTLKHRARDSGARLLSQRPNSAHRADRAAPCALGD